MALLVVLVSLAALGDPSDPRTVYGAGWADANGVYTVWGIVEGKTAYSNGAGSYIYWSSGRWGLKSTCFTGNCPPDDPATYVNYEDTPEPPILGWVPGGSTPGPAPAVDVVPPAPSTPDLDAASDSGQSSSDNITNDTTPTFSGIAKAGSLVRLYAGAAEVGSQQLGMGATAWTITSAALTPNVSYAFTATATNPGGYTGPASGALTVTIDTQNPTVTIAANDVAIYDGDVGVDHFTVTATFSEAMNPAVVPTLTFTPNPTTTFTNPSGTWSALNTVYTWTYDVVDVGVTVPDVDAGVSGGQDVAGNAQLANTNTDYVDIDTLNPTVVDILLSDLLITDADVGSTFTVTIDYSEPMLTGTAPTVVFVPGLATTLSLLGSSGWSDADTYVARYTVLDGGVTVNNDDVQTSLGRDLAGNVQIPRSRDDDLDVDTQNPTVTIAANDVAIYDGDVGVDRFTVTATFSEAMNPDIVPTLTFTPNPTTTFTNPSGTWSALNTVYTWTYDVVDVGVTVPGVDVAVSGGQDVVGNAQVANTNTDYVDIDTQNPVISGFSVTGGQVGTKSGNDCVREVTFAATVTDPSGRMEPNDIVITGATVPGGNASITTPYNVMRTAVSTTVCTIAGAVDVYELTSCPAVPRIVLDATDFAGNSAVQAHAEDGVYDAIGPTINAFTFNTDETYATPTNEYEVDECCVTTVYFSANVTDNCCVGAGNINVVVSLPTANAVIENVSWNAVQNGHKRVEVAGHADVRCLTSCYARVEVVITAHDCCQNQAETATSASDGGLVWDRRPPVPAADPNGYESARCDELEVRRDDFGQFRLMIRESTPTYIDVLCNDTDDCSACTCCGTLWIYDIVDQPEFGTATIVDSVGDCRGGTSIRYAPNRGYLGPDRFTYRIVDACSNVSEKATVYLQTIRETDLEDVFAVACSGVPAEIPVTATDLWIDPEDPGRIQFGFEIASGPEHGVLSINLGRIVYSPASTVVTHGILVPTLTFMESASVLLRYTGAQGYTGRDAVRVAFHDPFGAVVLGNVDIDVEGCQGESLGAPVAVPQGQPLFLIPPRTFVNVVDGGEPRAALAMALADGLIYPGVVRATWSESMLRYLVTLDTATLPLGEYRLDLPLGNGETATLLVEVGESQ